MATFMVPMFVLVEAESEEKVYDKVVQIQEAARGFGLLQDEILNPKAVSDDDEHRSILDAYTAEELTQPYAG